MTETQPNFEAIKRAFYQAYVDSWDVSSEMLKQSLSGHFLPSFHTRKEEFKKDFNTWLNRLDIRQAGALIQILKEQNKPVPNWAANGKYYIDYNRHDTLDLIKV